MRFVRRAGERQAPCAAVEVVVAPGGTVAPGDPCRERSLRTRIAERHGVGRIASFGRRDIVDGEHGGVVVDDRPSAGIARVDFNHIGHAEPQGECLVVLVDVVVDGIDPHGLRLALAGTGEPDRWQRIGIVLMLGFAPVVVLCGDHAEMRCR